MRYKLRYKIAEIDLKNAQIVKKRHNSKGTKFVLTKKTVPLAYLCGFQQFFGEKSKGAPKGQKGGNKLPKKGIKLCGFRC